ncbi:MAG: dihydroorotase [Clostridia bacterium]|nr:dihydroorotase [Clostridia bacterium]
MDLLIKNAAVFDGDGFTEEDIYIESGDVKKIGPSLKAEKGCRVLDAKGMIALPGLIDMHVHLREPGFEGKEDIESGSEAAVAGGFTQVCCMPNTDPVCDSAVGVSYIKYRQAEVGLCRINPIGAITKGQKGEALADIGKMAKAGAVAISDDGKSVMNSKMMRLAMEYASGFGLKCLCHCEDANLSDGGVVNEGYNSTLSGLKGQLRAVEDIMIAREIALSESLGIPTHICHVTTYSGVELIREAKRRGVPVTAETCPHYFTLTDDVTLDYNTNTKVNPPLREEKDRLAVIEGLKDGTIDCIVTDHAPHSVKDKEVEYDVAAFGFSGLETSFALSYTYLVKTGVITFKKLVELMSSNPAKILGLKGGSITCGNPGDITLVNVDERYTVDSSKFRSKGKNTPFDGWEVWGKIKATIVDGDIKYMDEGIES